MDDLLIILKGTIKIIKNFLPAFLFTVIGLAYIYLDEKKDKNKKKTFQTTNRKGPLEKYIVKLIITR